MADKRRNKIVVIFAHPAFEKSKLNAELFGSIQGLEDVTTRDLYELYPDFLIDVKKEQELLKQYDIIIFQHPFYWYSSPSIIKEWIDLVLDHGFAFGDKGTALRGKYLMSAITTGGGKESYTEQGVHYYNVKEFLKPFERTAVFCGMIYLPPFVIHNTSKIESASEISKYCELYKKVLTALRDSESDLSITNKLKYMNEYVV